ncbi:hypothetical protein AGMMS49975_16290 [Clostridia bacterium]|nr:hypothetical protein AGMMS49975_16290 [Clostridia bacterium]
MSDTSDVIRLLQTIAISGALWLIFVLVGFKILIGLAKPEKASSLVRVCYMIFIAAEAVFLFFFSPYRPFLIIGIGFWVTIIIILIAVIVLLVTGSHKS